MRVVRASHLGMCFGVRDAIAKVLRAGAREPLTVLGELVHNGTVLEQLAARGIRLRHEVAEVDTPSVMITAHGASERRRAAVRARGLRLLDATCPIVRAAHRTVTALAADGYHPVIVGTPNHVEVRGLTEDLDAFDVVSTDRRRGAAAAAAAVRRRGTDHAANRTGAAAGLADPVPVPAVGGARGRDHRLRADETPPGGRRRARRDVRRGRGGRRRPEQQHPRARARPAAGTANACSWCKARVTCGRSGSPARGWRASPPARPPRMPSSTASKPPCRTSRGGGWRDDTDYPSASRDPRGRARRSVLPATPASLAAARDDDGTGAPAPAAPGPGRAPDGAACQSLLREVSSRQLWQARAHAEPRAHVDCGCDAARLARPLLGREPAARPSAHRACPAGGRHHRAPHVRQARVRAGRVVSGAGIEGGAGRPPHPGVRGGSRPPRGLRQRRGRRADLAGHPARR